LTLIETKSSEYGLSAGDIDTLITVATSNKLREFIKPSFYGYCYIIVVNYSYEKLTNDIFLQCFDAVGWVAGRASGL